MHRTYIFRVPLTWSFLALASLSGMFGCGGSEQIEVYTVAKPHVLEQELGAHQEGGLSERMLAAIIADDAENGWFFKMVGDKDLVGEKRTAFVDFLRTVKFAKGKPIWTLPDRWELVSGGGVRFATIYVPSGDKALELSVSRMSLPEEDRDSMILWNINRWRGQMGLESIKPEQRDETTETITANGKNITVVNLTGRYNEKGMKGGGAGGFGMGMSGFNHPPIGDGGAPGKTGFDETLLTCEPPESWQPSALTSFRKAAYEVKDASNPDESVEITISSAGGSDLDNVNRWRGQIGLGPVTLDQLDEAFRPFDVGSQQGRLVELIGPENVSPRKAMYVIMVEANQRMWFIKLIGDASLAEREKQRFEAFAKTVEFK
jgi:hypothetical protein